MKMMKEQQNLSAEEWDKRVQDLRKELMKENNKVASATHPTSPGKLRLMKKTIARIRTLQQGKGVLKH